MFETITKKNKKRFWAIVLAATSQSLLLSTSANAGLITQHVSVGAFDRNCPGLSDPSYLDNHIDAIVAVYGSIESQGSQLVDTACRFNSSRQADLWNYDGTPKFEGLPTIPSFTDEQVGNLIITDATASDSLSLTTSTGNLVGEVSLDSDNLGLPVIKIDAKSQAGQRNSFNGYAATEYLWTGQDQRLEFGLDFDFFHSSESWGFPGYLETESSDLSLTAFVSEGLIIDSSLVFPVDNGNVLSSDSFSLKDTDVGITSEQDPYFGSLNVSFDVKNGQRFFVVGQFQGFAKNGGFLNAFNTITGSLTVEGFTEEQSEAIFETSLQLAPPELNAPTSLAFLIFGAGYLFLRRSS